MEKQSSQVMAGILTSSKALPNSSILMTHGIASKMNLLEADAKSSSDLLLTASGTYSMDLSKLEGFFQSLNKQIYELKCETQQCVSDYLYKEEVKLRAAYQQKVDQLFMDMNLIKDFVFSDNSDGYRNQSNKQDKVSLLKGEIENLKAVIRRMELQQCENMNVFQRIKAIEKNHCSLNEEFQEFKSRDLLEPIREDMLKAQGNVQTQLERAKQDLSVRLLVVETIIKEKDTDSLIATLQNECYEAHERIKEIEIVLSEQSASLQGAIHTINTIAATPSQSDGAFAPQPTTSHLGFVSLSSPRHDPAQGSMPPGSSHPSPTLVSATTASAASSTATIPHLRRTEIHPHRPLSPGSVTQEDGQRSDRHRGSSRATSPVGPGMQALFPPNSSDRSPSNPTQSRTPTTTTATAATATAQAVSSPRTSAIVYHRTPSVKGGALASEENRSAPIRAGTILKPTGRPSLAHNTLSTQSLDTLKAELHEMYASRREVSSLQQTVDRIGRGQDRLQDLLYSLRGLLVYKTLKTWQRQHRFSLLQHRFRHLAAVVRSEKASDQEKHRMRAEQVLQHLAKFSLGFQVHRLFHRWRQNSLRVAGYARLHKWLRNKLLPIFERYEPNLSVYIERWKQFVVDSYAGDMFGGLAEEAAPHRRGSMLGGALHAVREDGDGEESVAEGRERRGTRSTRSSFLVAAPRASRVGDGQPLVLGDEPASQAFHARTRSSISRSSMVLSGRHFSVGNLKKMAYEDLKLRWSFAEQQEEMEAASLQSQQQLRDFCQSLVQSRLQPFQEQVQLQLQLQFQPLSLQVQTLEEELHQTKKTLHRAIASLQEEKQDVHSVIDTHIVKLTTSLNQYKSSVTVKLSYMKEALDESLRGVEGQVHDAVQRVVVLEDAHQATRQSKERFRVEVEHLQRRLETCLLQYEDVVQYLVCFKETNAQLRGDVSTLVHKVQCFEEEVHGWMHTDKEQHHFLDEEVKWLKQVAQQQQLAATQFKSQCVQHFQDIFQTLHKSEDPRVMAREYDGLVSSVVDQAKRYLCSALLDTHVLRGQSTSPPLDDMSSTMATQGYRWMLAYLALARKIAAFIALYVDQEVLLHTMQQHLAVHPPTYRLQTQYANDLLGISAWGDVTAASLRDRMVHKCLRDVDSRLGVYLANPNSLLADLVDFMNDLHVLGPTESQARMAFFSPAKKDTHKMKHAFLSGLRTLLAGMLASLPSASTAMHDVGAGLAAGVCGTGLATPDPFPLSPVATTGGAMAMMGGMKAGASTPESQTLAAYQTYRAAMPPRKIHYQLSVGRDLDRPASPTSGSGVLGGGGGVDPSRPQSAPVPSLSPSRQAPDGDGDGDGDLPLCRPPKHVTGVVVQAVSGDTSRVHSPVHDVDDLSSSLLEALPRSFTHSLLSMGSDREAGGADDGDDRRPRTGGPRGRGTHLAATSSVVAGHRGGKGPGLRPQSPGGDDAPRRGPARPEPCDVPEAGPGPGRDLEGGGPWISCGAASPPGQSPRLVTTVSMPLMAGGQHRLAQSLAELLPIDRTIHPKQEEGLYSHQLAQDQAVLQTRPLVPRRN